MPGRAADDDVEGHGIQRDASRGLREGQGDGEGFSKSREAGDDDDVEGHAFNAPQPVLARRIAVDVIRDPAAGRTHRGRSNGHDQDPPARLPSGRVGLPVPAGRIREPLSGRVTPSPPGPP